MDRGAWRATVHGAAKESRLSHQHSGEPSILASYSHPNASPQGPILIPPVGTPRWTKLGGGTQPPAEARGQTGALRRLSPQEPGSSARPAGRGRDRPLGAGEPGCPDTGARAAPSGPHGTSPLHFQTSVP